ncbi:hypothetical protein C1646_672074 [Rhizophagus diaphanus]|nr:hypothetical protein C1646_672074 [Rhizophagus diaphanus] [Rhizophagus sp. MUCL 43196]
MLRGSRDGFAASKFHEICDNQPRIITIVKVKDSDKILGGYNPIGWSDGINGYGKTKESFIFSFESCDSIDDYILSRVANENCAIWNGCYYGPYFGSYDFALCGKDFYNESYCRKGTYEKKIRKTEDTFSVEEYEIFQIIKN